MSTAIEERHYAPAELAEKWGLDVSTIRRLFRDEPGVLKIGHDMSGKKKKAYATIRIPESVAQRFYFSRTTGRTKRR